VALIDKATFPRRKACGEGLGGRALAALEELGLRRELDGLPHAPFHGFTLWRGGNPARVQLGDTEPHFIGINRELLDTTLFRAAANTNGVVPFVGTQVRSVESWNPVAKISLGAHAISALKALRHPDVEIERTGSSWRSQVAGW